MTVRSHSDVISVISALLIIYAQLLYYTFGRGYAYVSLIFRLPGVRPLLTFL